MDSVARAERLDVTSNEWESEMSVTSTLSLHPLSDDEQRLVRLFRCMSIAEKSELLFEAATALMNRLSIDSHFRRQCRNGGEARRVNRYHPREN